MARLLFAMAPVWGHIAPTVAVAQTLQEAGHDVVYACHPSLKPVFDRAGLSLLTSFGWGESIIRCQALLRQPGSVRLAYARGTSWGRRVVPLEDLDAAVSGFLDVIDTWQPDAVISDVYCVGAGIASEIAGIPYASSCSLAVPFPGEGIPPYTSGLPTGGRRGPAWRFHEAMIRLAEYRRCRDINKVRRSHGLPFRPQAVLHASPYLYVAYTTEALERRRRDLPPQVWYVGPSMSATRGDHGLEFPWDWLDGRPLVYITLGTIFSAQTGFFRKAMAACRGQPWQAVIKSEPAEMRALSREAPPNVRLWVDTPQIELINRAAVVVAHGGMNTVVETLAAGKPLIVTPVALDNHDVACQVVESGSGVRIRFDRLRAGRLRRAIHDVLNQACWTRGARRVAEDFGRCEAPEAAASLFLKLVRDRAPVLRPPGRAPTLYRDEIAGLS